MPESVMTLFPHMLTSLEAMKFPLQAVLALNQIQQQSVAASTDLFKNTQDMTLDWVRQFSRFLPPGHLQNGDK